MALLTVSEASNKYKVPIRTLYHNIEAGVLPTVDVTTMGLPLGIIILKESDVSTFASNRPKKGRPKKKSQTSAEFS